MADEYWATFSIYDHRQSLYRRTLVLFDRVVMPVPTKPVGDLSQEEIDRLAADADYLEREGVAIRFDWDRDEFFEWQRQTANNPGVDSEAIAKILAKDPPFATRLQLSNRYNQIMANLLPPGVDSVTAIPAYGSIERYYDVTNNLRNDVAEQKVLQIVFKQLPVPDDNAPLEDIIRLRNDPLFKTSMEELREWQLQTVAQLLVHKNEKAIRAVEKDFSNYVSKYREAMDNAKFKKVEIGFISLLTLGGTVAVGAAPLIAILAQIAPAILAVREVAQPSWKQVSDMECAPAGVVYAASQLV